MSNRYVLLVQPCQKSLVGLTKWIYFLLGFASWEKEFYYPKKRYIDLFSQRGYYLKDFAYVRLREVMVFLFDKELKGNSLNLITYPIPIDCFFNPLFKTGFWFES